MINKSTLNDQFFLETPMGILTQKGDLFHTNSKQIQSFAPGLLDKISLKKLIKEAQAWVNSPDSLSLILLYGLLFLTNPWVAAAVVLAFHWFWYRQKSAFVVRGASRLFRIFNSDAFLFLLAFISLTLLGYHQQYGAVGIGLVYFFVMKPGLLKKGWDKMSATGPDDLTPNDRVLKMVIIKQAVYEDLTPADVKKMEERLREAAFNQRKGS